MSNDDIIPTLNDVLEAGDEKVIKTALLEHEVINSLDHLDRTSLSLNPLLLDDNDLLDDLSLAATKPSSMSADTLGDIPLIAPADNRHAEPDLDAPSRARSPVPTPVLHTNSARQHSTSKLSTPADASHTSRAASSASSPPPSPAVTPSAPSQAPAKATVQAHTQTITPTLDRSHDEYARQRAQALRSASTRTHTHASTTPPDMHQPEPEPELDFHNPPPNPIRTAQQAAHRLSADLSSTQAPTLSKPRIRAPLPDLYTQPAAVPPEADASETDNAPALAASTPPEALFETLPALETVESLTHAPSPEPAEPLSSSPFIIRRESVSSSVASHLTPNSEAEHSYSDTLDTPSVDDTHASPEPRTTHTTQAEPSTEIKPSDPLDELPPSLEEQVDDILQRHFKAMRLEVMALLEERD